MPFYIGYETDLAWLVHHGIKGQKWGLRNGPPYPLGEGDHSAAEKKAAQNDKHTGGSRVRNPHDRLVRAVYEEKAYLKLI